LRMIVAASTTTMAAAIQRPGWRSGTALISSGGTEEPAGTLPAGSGTDWLRTRLR